MPSPRPDALYVAHVQIHLVGNDLHALHAAGGFVTDIEPMTDRVYGLDELPAAKAHIESKKRLGKIVVRMQDT